ncbi:unnamed protein product [Ascophyllum nodosum]
MENWRHDAYSSVTKALRRIERKSDKLSRRINGPRNYAAQCNNQLAFWEDEIARLRAMTERLLDFRDRLYFYSNVDYVEALNEWESIIARICIFAEGLKRSSTGGQNRNRERGNRPREESIDSLWSVQS